MSNASAATHHQPGPPAESYALDREAALAFLTNLAAEVSRGTVDLPCFPNVVLRISLALADPKTTTERVVIMVGAEPLLSAKILQTANSAAFNTSGKPVAELRSAITRLGHQMVHGVAMAYAMQTARSEAALKAITPQLTELWNRSITVASLSQLTARRTKLNPDVAFLTGLLHGIGKLYIMVRAVTGKVAVAGGDASWLEMVAGWHASVGKTVLENWGFSPELCEAVGEQTDFERRWRHTPTLTDVLIAGTVLADALGMPEPRSVGSHAANAFISIGMTPADCSQLLQEAEAQIRLVHEALA